jgi:hypothetical protein
MDARGWDGPQVRPGQLGHASISQTADAYGHVAPEAHEHAGEALDHVVWPSVKESPCIVLVTLCLLAALRVG